MTDSVHFVHNVMFINLQLLTLISLVADPLSGLSPSATSSCVPRWRRGRTRASDAQFGAQNRLVGCFGRPVSLCPSVSSRGSLLLPPQRHRGRSALLVVGPPFVPETAAVRAPSWGQGQRHGLAQNRHPPQRPLVLRRAKRGSSPSSSSSMIDSSTPRCHGSAETLPACFRSACSRRTPASAGRRGRDSR